ncbi:MAG: type IV toxin-antitoxin system AbiEi family antitoxin [Gammaproteobacteria bacterium]|nr:type IV toxin-antitoxin system AbiEi family antitoxin [Gammaproteobacteria bacterium]
MKVNYFINQLRSKGRYSFSLNEAVQYLNLPKVSILKTLQRMKKQGSVASVAKGFYLVVPPEYQSFGCLPADLFISDLMQFLRLPYYVGYLSAAQLYGAAHQKPQRFQVVTLKNRRPIRCGRIAIEFIANKKMESLPTQKLKTATGYINVAEPELLAADLINAPQHAGGINNVATILMELANSFDIARFKKLAVINAEVFWIQRLGYLFDILEMERLADGLGKILDNKTYYWLKLVPDKKYQALSRNAKWKIIVNTDVEPDE